MSVFDLQYAVPLGLKYHFISSFFYLKCRSYGTLMANIEGFFTTASAGQVLAAAFPDG